MARSKKQEAGAAAEREAEQYLCSQGLTLLQRNYLHKTGEIDLIMQDQDDLVFVEVRLRNETDHASALESITPDKQSKIIRTAKLYLQEAELYFKVTARFDVVTFDQVDGAMKMQWIKNAFGYDGF